MAAHDIPPMLADTPLLDTAHPGFKRAIFVLCDQLWMRSLGLLAGTIVLPFWIWLVRLPVGLIFPTRHSR